MATGDTPLLHEATHPDKRLKRWWQTIDPIALAMICCVYALVLFLNRNHTFPADGDEATFSAATMSGYWMEWFTQGFSQYFRLYDSWSSHEGQFKPVDIFVYWIFFKLCSGLSFHDFLLIYLFFYCVAVFCGARLLYHCTIALGMREGAARLVS